jgi:hypothetical protein
VAKRSTDNSRAVATTARLNIGDHVMRKCAMVLLLTLPLFGSQPVIATDCAGNATYCDRCGRQTACVERVCQVVCGMKKETRTCWCVECKEICPLMPSCHHGCCECPPPPRCGHPRCVKKLVKKEYQVDVPVYKCVVLHLCPECCNGGPTNAPNTAPTPATAPEPPAIPPAPSIPVPSPRAQK